MTTVRTDSATLPQPLKLWEKIVVVVGEGADAGRYASRIEDFEGDGLLIDEPQFMSGHTLLREGLAVTVQVTREDAIYEFESQISRGGTAKKGQAVLSAPGNFRRVQRRLFVRIEMNLPVEYAVVISETDWSCWEKSLVWRDTTACDISGGGICIKTAESVAVGTLLLVRIRRFRREGLPEYMFAVCRRERSEKSGLSVGMEFLLIERLDQFHLAPNPAELPPALTGFNHAAQNRLVVWIFNRQIILRQKGLL